MPDHLWQSQRVPWPYRPPPHQSIGSWVWAREPARIHHSRKRYFYTRQGYAGKFPVLSPQYRVKERYLAMRKDCSSTCSSSGQWARSPMTGWCTQELPVRLPQAEFCKQGLPAGTAVWPLKWHPALCVRTVQSGRQSPAAPHHHFVDRDLPRQSYHKPRHSVRNHKYSPQALHRTGWGTFPA